MLRPPSTLSLIVNATETIEFLVRFEQAIPLHQVFIEFSGVEEITPDAPLAIIGIMKRFQRGNVRGSQPISAVARNILQQSGFFDHVRHRLQIDASQQGSMVRRSGTTVDGSLARELILRGTEKAFGVSCDSEPAYCILLEGMQNTVDHAHFERGKRATEKKRTESWWVSVYADRERKRVCFALLDVGVGILRSAKIRALRRIDQLLRKAADGKILSDLLDGVLESRTGLDNRGKGLPKIRSLSEAGEIKNLVIVSNGVHAHVSTKVFTSLPLPFTGTLIYWEIEK